MLYEINSFEWSNKSSILLATYSFSYDNTLIATSCCLSVLNQARSNTQYKYRDIVIYDDCYLSWPDSKLRHINCLYYLELDTFS